MEKINIILEMSTGCLETFELFGEAFCTLAEHESRRNE